MTPVVFASSYGGLGGGETALLALVAHMAATDAALVPHLLVAHDGDFAAAWRAHGWPTHVLPFRGASAYFVPWAYARFPVVGRMAALLRDVGARAVYTEYHALPFAAAAARRAGARVVFGCWGWWFRPRPWQRGFFHGLDALFAYSHVIQRGFLGAPPFLDPARVPVIPPGVDAARFQPDATAGPALRAELGLPPGAPLVGVLARFQPVKGHTVVHEVARRVLAAVPGAHVFVAGENTHTRADDTYKRGVLAAWHADPLLRAHVHYLGARADAPHLLAAADVVLCPSDFESFGMVNVEAMACATPVVSTNAGGPAETVLDGTTGFLCPPRDAEALAARVVQLLTDADLRARMGAAGRAHVQQHFCVAASATHLAALLRETSPPLSPPAPR